MPQVNPLAVDRSKEGSAVQILPCPPLLANHKFGWNGFHVQHHKQLAWESVEHSVTYNTIVVHHFEHPIYTQQMVDGRKQRRQIINGHIAIAPANVEQKAFWDKEIGFTLLFLEPAYITRIADESVELERFELVAHFAKPDLLNHQIGLALKTELEAGELDTQLSTESAATMLSAHLLRHYSAQKHRLPKERGRLSQRRLQPVIDYINPHLDKNLSLAELAAVAQMSSYYFVRSFKQSFGVPPYQYLLQCRIEKAKKLLAKEDLSIAEISHQVGFHHQSGFTSKFRKLVGVTPKKYRNKF